jgi:hypothetical protein
MDSRVITWKLEKEIKKEKKKERKKKLINNNKKKRVIDIYIITRILIQINLTNINNYINIVQKYS